LTRRTIIVGAHYDHLGVGAPDTNGDTIYNGFSDNAAGVGMLLAMATVLAEEALTHTVMFLFFDGEELGLLGADAYVHSPLVPLVETKAVIVLDAGAPPAPPTSWELSGTPGLGEVASEVAKARGWNTRVSQARPNSDYYPFTLAGVEGMLIIPGPDPYEGLTEEETRLLGTVGSLPPAWCAAEGQIPLPDAKCTARLGTRPFMGLDPLTPTRKWGSYLLFA